MFHVILVVTIAILGEGVEVRKSSVKEIIQKTKLDVWCMRISPAEN